MEAEYITLPSWVPIVICMGILVFSLLIAVLVWKFDYSYWTERMCEVRDNLQKQVDEICKEYKDMAKEYPALKNEVRNQRQTIKYYQGLLSWCTDVEGKKIDEFVRKQTEDKSFKANDNV